MDTASPPILLVEDNPDDVVLTLRALVKNRIRNPVETARDGVEALAWLDQRCTSGAGLPALVLLDLKMPRMDGLETLRSIRADPRTALLRVIMLTTSREEQDLVQSWRLGVSSYIRKPVEFEKFVAAIGALGMYWLATNQPPPAPPAIAGAP